MADYREISQDYAKGAIKAAMLINAGASVALLTQTAQLLDEGIADEAAYAMSWWAAGLVSAMFTWILGFASTRYVDKAEKEDRERHLVTADRFMYAGLLAVIVSIICFVVGCVTLACSLLRGA